MEIAQKHLSVNDLINKMGVCCNHKKGWNADNLLWHGGFWNHYDIKKKDKISYNSIYVEIHSRLAVA